MSKEAFAGMLFGSAVTMAFVYYTPFQVNSWGPMALFILCFVLVVGK